MPPIPPPSPSIPGFSSSRVIPAIIDDLTPVAEDLMEHFRVQGYEVTGERVAGRGWYVSISKGTIFAAVVGMKTALNIELESTSTATLAKAGIGLFGRHVIPVLIARFVAWPVWLTQIWGLVQQARLDDEALDAVERSVRLHATRVSEVQREANAAPKAAAQAAESRTTVFCTSCGARLPDRARFCPECGTKTQE